MPPRTKFKTIDQYIKSCPKHVQPILKKMRQVIHQTAPKAEQTISYNIPTFKMSGTYLVYVAGYEHHVSLYPVPKTTAAFAKEVSPYRSGKGTIRFSLDKPIPYAFIKKIVRERMKEIAAKAKK